MYKTLSFISLFLISFIPVQAQSRFRVMSYNVENLFDTQPSLERDDSEFQPKGKRHWTESRYYHKLQQIAKVISAVGEWDTPALVGLCEVENDSVMCHLLRRTSLRKQEYRYCITTGQDQRGINTALLYQRDKFRYLIHKEYPIPFTNPRKKSRNILYVSGRIITQDTLDVFVCHFPSRYGGEKETEQSRMEAAVYLRGLCDSLYKTRAHCLLLIMGDFNEVPQNELFTHWFTPPPSSDSTKTGLTFLNLFAKAKGSHKYHDTWSQLDQIIINTELYPFLQTETPVVFSPSFLLTNDKTWRGKRPLRTYHGYKYEKGFSDHLPIIADFNL
ncbi:MAG: endonuclease [Massilibacteroides sp.]|nr:endonuclease [Massilibacteroides sp.]MDD4659497.1 endonuclease [Massilibacteroides sp.]